MTAQTEHYLNLWQKALTLPKPYRAGLEARMRSVYRMLTPAEKAALASY